MMDSIAIAKAVKSNLLSLWFADGTNYPGQDDIVERKQRMHGALRQWHDAMPKDMKMLIEYKPFEPAFYHTDSADWGMAYVFAKDAGPRAKVLVDTGHHLPGTNIEHIVALLLDEEMLGGFHFNDRRYADDDLTLGSIDPYGMFRIFHEIRNAADLRDQDVSSIAYMIDQSHNLKPKIEAMIQTAVTAQELYAKACLVNRTKLCDAQTRGDIVDAEECLKDAFAIDVRPMLAEWRKKKRDRSQSNAGPTAPAAMRRRLGRKEKEREGIQRSRIIRLRVANPPSRPNSLPSRLAVGPKAHFPKSGPLSTPPVYFSSSRCRTVQRGARFVRYHQSQNTARMFFRRLSIPTTLRSDCIDA